MEEDEKRWKSMEEVLSESHYSLFTATDRNNLLDDYPELREYPAIMTLGSVRPKDLLWVWHFACRSSKAMDLHTERERIAYAVKVVWPKAEERELFDLLKKFTDRDKELQDAVNCMKAFRPEGRFVMHVACEQMINTSKAVMDVDPRDVKAIVDWAEKKKAIEALDAALELMHKAQKMSEHGLGVKLTSRTTRNRGDALKRVHASQQQQA